MMPQRISKKILIYLFVFFTLVTINNTKISNDFYKITERILKISKECSNGKVVSILEGGYDLNALAESANEHVNALIEFN